MGFLCSNRIRAAKIVYKTREDILQEIFGESDYDDEDYDDDEDEGFTMSM